MDEQEIKEFIKQNLNIESDFESQYSAGNNMVISLRFDGDSIPFATTTVYIPDAD